MKTAALPDDLSIPDELKRKDSPASKAARTRILKQSRTVHRVADTEQRDRKGVPPGFAIPADEAGWELLRATIQRRRDRIQEGLARLAQWKEENGAMTATAKKIGPKEAGLRTRRETPDKLKELNSAISVEVGAANARIAARKPRAKDSFTPEQKAKLETQRKEHLKAADAATKVKPKAGSLEALFEQNGLRVKSGDKYTINFQLMQYAIAHPKGFEWDAIAKHVGWKRANWAVGELCAKFKADLSEKDGKVFVTLKK